MDEAGKLLGGRLADVAAVGPALLVCEEAYGKDYSARSTFRDISDHLEVRHHHVLVLQVVAVEDVAAPVAVEEDQ